MMCDEKGGRALEQVCLELMTEVRRAPPGARLSARLRAALERLSPCVRREVVSRCAEGCAPLLVAARRGCAEIAEYLLHVCGAYTEQRGAFRAPEDSHTHLVTPLWAAAVAGQLRAVRVLADAGAHVDAPSDSGSTPARSACFMSHVEVVRELAARGADLARPNHSGSTCLINAVQCPELASFLLACNVPVDAHDVQLKSALHYAAQEHRADTVRLLLDHGANPYKISRAGDDTLQIACLKGAAHIVALLVARCRYPAHRVVDAYELLGATLLDEFNDVSAALEAWRRATILRHAGNPIRKLPFRYPPRSVLGGLREWTSLEELEAQAMDVDWLRAQALLVVYRILGGGHRDAVFRIMYRGAAYADAHVYGRCLELWGWALFERVSRDSVLSADASHAACALTRLVLAAAAAPEAFPNPLQHAIHALELLASTLRYAQRRIMVRPQCRRQVSQYDACVRCVTQLMAVCARCHCSNIRTRLVMVTRRLVLVGVRTAATRDTLLHLAVSRLNVVRSPYFADDVPLCVFPCVRVTGLLLRCGAAVGARNASASTALHVASVSYNMCAPVLALLLAAGAHIDQPNQYGDSPAQLVAINRAAAVPILQHVTLKCLAARALVAHGLPPGWSDDLPAEVAACVALHQPPSASPSSPREDDFMEVDHSESAIARFVERVVEGLNEADDVVMEPV